MVGNRRGPSQFENAQKFVGKILRGEVISNPRGDGGENPVIKPFRPAPNVIVDGEARSDWERGDIMAVEVYEATDTALFGERVKEKGEEREREKRQYVVVFHVVGHRFESAAFAEEDAAESVRAYLEDRHDTKASVERLQ